MFAPQIGDRVRTTRGIKMYMDTPGDLPEGLRGELPAGTPGTVTNIYWTGEFGVLLDDDPDQLPLLLQAHDLEAVRP